MEAPNTKPYHLPADAVWFITGCSSGIGQALAHLVAETPKNRIVATARKLSSLSGFPAGSEDRVLKLEVDVTLRASIDAALDAALAKFGRIDVVVNNAGYTLEGDTEAAGDAEARALLDTNFWGMVDVTKRALGIMRDENPKSGGQQGGVILNVSSVGGWSGFAGGAFYHASKFAMEGFTEAVAKELPSAWNIHLCNIEPGGVKTNYATTSLQHMAKRHPAYADPSYPTNQLLAYVVNEDNHKTWAKPQEIAAAMYHIVSRGQRIPIRVPLGSDSYSLITKDLEENRKLLDELKELSLSVGDGRQPDTIRFLK
ncbi:NAD(P)-binding protein [Camillea tinctor]|nr:NAD(P)-binding protein [Camillea tinctor]